MSDYGDDSNSDEFDDGDVLEALLASDIGSSQQGGSSSIKGAEIHHAPPNILNDPYEDPFVEALMQSEACFKTDPVYSDPRKSTISTNNLHAPHLKRKRSTEDVVEESPDSKKPLKAINKGDPGIKQDRAVGPVSDTPYRLDFGKHRDKTLDEVPSQYVDFLVDERVYQNRPALASALRAKGLLGDTSRGKANIESRLSSWRKPSLDEMMDSRMWNEDEEEARWITPSDARKYFKINSHLLQHVRIKPLPQKASYQLPLYQVYACAAHFKTITSGTTQQAYENFLSKNDQREREVVAEAGYFVDCGCFD